MRMWIPTSTPRGPMRLRDIKLVTSVANSSGTSSCKSLGHHNFNHLYTLYKEKVFFKNKTISTEDGRTHTCMACPVCLTTTIWNLPCIWPIVRGLWQNNQITLRIGNSNNLGFSHQPFKMFLYCRVSLQSFSLNSWPRIKDIYIFFFKRNKLIAENNKITNEVDKIATTWKAKTKNSETKVLLNHKHNQTIPSFPT